MGPRKRVNAKPAGGLRRPKMGQNFLSDAGAARRIVETLGDIRDATVVEIGAGKGALTDLLSRDAGRLIAIEKDRVLGAQLRMRYAQRRNVEIVEADVLTVDLPFLIERRADAMSLARPISQQKARVIGNLPYYITSDILLRLFSFHEWLESMVLMVQREVADRIAASPGTRDYGLLSATAQLYAKVEKLFTLAPGAFSPPPQVHSSVLRLTVRPRMGELGLEAEGFIGFLKTSFGQKRKTLTNNLKAQYGEPAVARAMRAAGVRSDARAEAIPLEKAAAIFRALQEARAGG